ncbi:isochorismatase family protein [Granulosicoccaceae sp. 1_MG-2023]|nr:isochorismatase family protein [Granulosicoccaceae sp. 1_MG-2023]
MHTLQAQQSLLLLIDWQSRLLPALPHGQAALQRSVLLGKGAALYDVPVLVTEHCADKIGGTDPGLLESLSAPHMIHKTHFSACRGTALLSDIQAGERRQIVVAGAETHVCVLQTVLDLLAPERRVYVVCDALASRKSIDYKTALQRMQQAGAELVTSEMVLFEWQACAGDPGMREMLSLVR